MKNLENLSLKLNVDVSKIAIILKEIDSGVQKIQVELDRISTLFEDLSKVDIPMNLETPETLNTNDEYICIDGKDYKVLKEQEYETCKGCDFRYRIDPCGKAMNLVDCVERKVIFKEIKS